MNTALADHLKGAVTSQVITAAVTTIVIGVLAAGAVAAGVTWAVLQLRHGDSRARARAAALARWQRVREEDQAMKLANSGRDQVKYPVRLLRGRGQPAGPARRRDGGAS